MKWEKSIFFKLSFLENKVSLKKKKKKKKKKSNYTQSWLKHSISIIS